MTLQAGFHTADITPFFDTGRDRVDTPFHCAAGVWASEGRCVATVGMDIAALNRDLVDEARGELARRMPLDGLLVGASHTHAGPDSHHGLLTESEIRALDDLPPDAIELLVRDMPRIQPDYRRLLVKRLVDAVWNAYQRLEDVRLVIGRATVDNVAYNRRQTLKDGTTVTHAGLGKRAREIVGNAGPVDTGLAALGAVNARGETIGALVNFGCHATVVQSNAFSADWPYYMRETVKQVLNPRMTVVFLNGCCGDVTQLDNLNPRVAQEPRTERQALVLGERVGFGAVEALRAPMPESCATLRFASETLSLGYRLTESDYRRARAEWDAAVKARALPSTLRFLKAPLLVWHAMKKQPAVPCELNALQIGNLLLLTAPGEMFARLSLDLKAASAFPLTMVASLTNDIVGYVPTPDAFGPGGGGYETRLTEYSRLDVGAFDAIEAKLLEMMAAFKPERTERKGAPS